MVSIGLKLSGFTAAMHRVTLGHMRGNECTVSVLSVEGIAMGLLHTQATGTALEN